MAGAGLLTAQGALYGGGGKIALASVGNAAFQLAGKIPEVMVSSCGDAPCFTEDMSDKAVKQTGIYDVVALGRVWGGTKKRRPLWRICWGTAVRPWLWMRTRSLLSVIKKSI